nr:MAG TPA: hypothetical protein [Bacteriophage sp.]
MLTARKKLTILLMLSWPSSSARRKKTWRV